MGEANARCDAISEAAMPGHASLSLTATLNPGGVQLVRALIHISGIM
jgi:hypothetical protein